MDIKYLTVLANYPSITGVTGYVNKLVPLPLDEIVQLEAIYNDGKPFPAALRELLYLAGGYCYALEFGVYDTQFEMQAEVRSWLASHNKTLTRPFFAIDVYNPYDQFMFIYLDENTEDPIVRQAVLFDESNYPSKFVSSGTVTLSRYIEGSIEKILKGYNPF